MTLVIMCVLCVMEGRVRAGHFWARRAAGRRARLSCHRRWLGGLRRVPAAVLPGLKLDQAAGGVEPNWYGAQSWMRQPDSGSALAAHGVTRG